jgi:hypothetical protein
MSIGNVIEREGEKNPGNIEKSLSRCSDLPRYTLMRFDGLSLDVFHWFIGKTPFYCEAFTSMCKREEAVLSPTSRLLDFLKIIEVSFD